MLKDKQLAIETISKTCAGRTCLKQCIDHIRAADTPPHTTCCGGGGYSRARVLVLWVLAIFSLLILSCKLYAQEVNSGVVVDINGVGTFVGGSVTITGWGNGGGGDGEPTIVITNLLGVCTNCTQISADEVHRYGYNLKSQCDIDSPNPSSTSIMGLMQTATNVISDIISYIDDRTADISKFISVSYPSPSAGYVGSTNAVRNLLDSLDDSCTQATLVSSFADSVSWDTSRFGVYHCNRILGYSNGIYDYAQTLVNSGYGLGYWRYTLDVAQDNISTLESTARQIDDIANVLITAEECRGDPDYYEPTNPPSGGGTGGNDTACLEQLQTLTAIVDHIDNDMHRHLDTLNTISNNVYKIDKNLDIYGRQVVDALFSHRETIPNQDDLQTYFSTTWQDVYLRGSPTDWGYNPTNVLERIELLLYGLSGVGTNTTDLADSPENHESAANSLISQVEGITSDAAVHQTNVESLGHEIASFFSTFTSFAGRAMSANEQILPPVRVTLDGEQMEVPAFQLSSQDHGNLVTIFNNFAVFVRAVCVTLYLIAALVLLWFYWGWFCKWAVSFSKWACEILTSLFAS